MVAYENCYFCGKPCQPEIFLRDEKGDHPVCKDCHDHWADTEEDWPPTRKRKVIPPDS